MRQRDAEDTLQGTLPFRPENNSPFFRHLTASRRFAGSAAEQPRSAAVFYTYLPTLPEIGIIILLFSAGCNRKNAPDPKIRGRFQKFRKNYWAEEAAASSAAFLAAAAFSACAFLMALYFSFSSAVATGMIASRGQTFVQSLQPTHLS